MTMSEARWPITKRSSLKTDTLYFEVANAMYFWTPDKAGVYWMNGYEAELMFGREVKQIDIFELED
jgi:hypothetical protein